VSKKNRRSKEAHAPPSRGIAAQGMSIDAILAQLSSIKESHRLAVKLNPDAEQTWKDNAAACEAATDILTALQDEGIRDPEQVRDLVHDYNALAEQYRKMHEKYEVPIKAQRLGTGGFYICPECHRRIYGSPMHCAVCGKRLTWGR